MDTSSLFQVLVFDDGSTNTPSLIWTFSALQERYQLAHPIEAIVKWRMRKKTWRLFSGVPFYVAKNTTHGTRLTPRLDPSNPDVPVCSNYGCPPPSYAPLPRRVELVMSLRLPSKLGHSLMATTKPQAAHPQSLQLFQPRDQSYTLRRTVRQALGGFIRCEQQFLA